MSYLGWVVEVFWPPEGEDTQGCWYRGRLDRYDGGGDGYHVAYDDGDEETLGLNVEGRDDVRLLSPPPDEEGSTPSKLHRVQSEEVLKQRKEGVADRDAVEAIEGGRVDSTLYDSGILEADEENGRDEAWPRTTEPTDRGFAAISYREIERPPSLGEEDGGSRTSCASDTEHVGYSFCGDKVVEEGVNGRIRDPNAFKHNSHDDQDGGGDFGGHGDTSIEEAHQEPSTYHGDRMTSSGSDYSLEGGGDEEVFAFDDEDEFSPDSDPGMLRPHYGCGGRESYRRESGGKCEVRRGGAERAGGTEHDEGLGTGESSPYGNSSSEWTPLRGTAFTAPPTRQDRSGEWSPGSSANEKAFFSRGENASTDEVGATTASAEARIHALTSAVNSNARQAGIYFPGAHHEEPVRHFSSRPGKERLGNSGAPSGAEESLRALEALVHDTALLEGGVEGVDGAEAKRAAKDKGGEGVFVKVSFIDGSGGNKKAATETNAMFRCKTLLHTTGSAPVTRGYGGDGGATRWPGGDFQCEAFHGGRLSELANAAILFSAHRSMITNSASTGRGLDREGFLGQVTLPLSSVLHNLRPVVEMDATPHVPKTGVVGEDVADREENGTSNPESRGRGSDNNDSVRNNSVTANRNTNNANNANINNDGHDTKSANNNGNYTNGRWRSVRGEISGTFPTADRHGRVSVNEAGTTGKTHLRLRLRLSVSLLLRSTGDFESAADSQRASADRENTEGAAAPYRTVGVSQRDPTLPPGGVSAKKNPGQLHNQRLYDHPAATDADGRSRRRGERIGIGRAAHCPTPATAAAAVAAADAGGGRGGGGRGGGRAGGGGSSARGERNFNRKIVTKARKSNSSGKSDPQATFLRHHGAAVTRQRLKRQHDIARENERIERRLKVIREAVGSAPSSYHRYNDRGMRPSILRAREKGAVMDEGSPQRLRRKQNRCRHPSRYRRRPKDTIITEEGQRGRVSPRRPEAIVSGIIRGQGAGCSAWTPSPLVDCGGVGESRGIKKVPSVERHRNRVGHDDNKGSGNDTGNDEGGGREADWRRIYNEREKLALAVERAATETAGARAKLEALRGKTLWTEANARSASLAVASLEKERGRRRRAATAKTAASGAGGVMLHVELNSGSGVVEERLAAELRRQEELYKALVEARRAAVTAGEESRLAREADLEQLKKIKAQLAQAEARQERHQWRRQQEQQSADHADERGGQGGAREHGSGRGVKDTVDADTTLPKDALERAQDLALSLRVEVETLRLEEAMGEETRAGACEGAGPGGSRASSSRAAFETQEEVASIKARVESKARRLEAATFDRDAIRAEYQNWIGTGQRSALKESLTWLEHASLVLSKA